ncbi:MAG TPA: ring-cleaving dioxygenase [Bryobacteraceae bacterium]|nr:ring-cleaving dioxygenase [Bryobacteraceae bacterium]
MKPTIGGIHHITAISADPQQTLDFYSGFLGLRLVKKTVNFDDPGTYHFYFGDYHGRPGTILTFFPWPGARRGRAGAGQVTGVALAVPFGALESWQARAREEGALVDVIAERFGERVLRLYDPDGLAIELIESAAARAEIGVFHSATLNNADPGLLTNTLGFRETARAGARVRYEAGAGGHGATVDIETTADRRGAIGAGTVHHIAWRTPDDEQQLAWRSELITARHEPTPVIDRQYFHSIYFREPGGVLYEIATEPPGFTVDEPLEALGSELRLPPQYEPMRARIEAVLPAVRPPGVIMKV